MYNEEGIHMAVSYNGLWKLLIDKKMKKVDMMNQVGISSSTVAKMTNDELVSMKVLEKICEKLDCDFGDKMCIRDRQSIWCILQKRILHALILIFAFRRCRPT